MVVRVGRLYTGTRPGLNPAIWAEKGWRARRELAPRRYATQKRCMLLFGIGQTRNYKRNVRTSTTTTTTRTTTTIIFGVVDRVFVYRGSFCLANVASVKIFAEDVARTMLGRGLAFFLDPWNVVGLRTTANVVTVKYGPHGEHLEFRPRVAAETWKACALIGFAHDRWKNHLLVLRALWRWEECPGSVVHDISECRALEILGQDWSSEEALLLEDWELARLALICPDDSLTLQGLWQWGDERDERTAGTGKVAAIWSPVSFLFEWGAWVFSNGRMVCAVRDWFYVSHLCFCLCVLQMSTLCLSCSSRRRSNTGDAFL